MSTPSAEAGVTPRGDTFTAHAPPEAFDLTRQAKWEVEGSRRAARRYREAAAVADPSTLPSGQQLLRRIVPAISASIQARQDTAPLQKQGAAHANLCLLDPPALALITGTILLNRTGLGATTTTLAMSIADAVRDEVAYLTWADEASKTDAQALARFQRAYPNPSQKTWHRWRRKVAAARSSPWSRASKLALGSTLVACAVETAPDVFLTETRHEQGGTVSYVVLAPSVVVLMQDVEARAEVARPLLMPMLIPPNPWKVDKS